MVTARERMKEIREHRRLSQRDMAAILGISHQAYGKKERGEADGFSPDDFEKILKETDIDARWLFGQLGGPIEGADLLLTAGKGDAAEVHEVITEYRQWKERFAQADAVSQRIQSDPELKQCVELLIQNRGEVGRVIGYIERGAEERSSRVRPRAEQAG